MWVFVRVKFVTVTHTYNTRYIYFKIEAAIKRKSEIFVK